jgi:hypothetical protein
LPPAPLPSEAAGQAVEQAGVAVRAGPGHSLDQGQTEPALATPAPLGEGCGADQLSLW